jgi:hypothetical protein
MSPNDESALLREDEEEEEETSRPRKRGRPLKSESKTKSRGPKVNRTCPHCDKLCSTAYGLRYHLGTLYIVCIFCCLLYSELTSLFPRLLLLPFLEHNVCRKECKSQPSTVDGPCAGPVGIETSTGRRTCNRCQKLCASVGGLKYHIGTFTSQDSVWMYIVYSGIP